MKLFLRSISFTFTIFTLNSYCEPHKLNGGWVMDGWCGFESGAIWLNNGNLEYTNISDGPPDLDKERLAGNYTYKQNIIEVFLPDTETFQLYYIKISGKEYLSKKPLDSLLLDVDTSFTQYLLWMYRFEPLFDKNNPLALACTEYWREKSN